ncbi:MAG: apolipoprotein N-acyltransferase [Prolixibacteraceae bacterium]|nr:apolipoprotein N-acyltransferase [Prolixibacteraceae bacterium]
MPKPKTFILAFLSGILLSFPWLAQGLDMTLCIAFYPLLFAEEQLISQKVTRFNVFFLHSFLAFFTWNILSTWWIAHVSISGMLLITLLNSMVMSLVWSLRHPIRQKFGILLSYFSLIVFWLSFEFIQHHSAIPWPWLTLGNGFADNVKIIQWYEFTGVFGGSVWLLLLNILVFNASVNPTLAGKVKGLAIALLVLVFPILVSLVLYENYREKGNSLNVLVIQPNIDPFTEKFSGISPENQINRILNLAKENTNDSINMVAAPETAWPSFSEDSALIGENSLKRSEEIFRSGTMMYFLTGALTRRPRIDFCGQSESESYNSAVFIDSEMNVQVSHKNILVNGVERMPFQNYFTFLDGLLLNLGGEEGSLRPGEKPDLFSIANLGKVGPVICYESVYGEYVSRMANSGANLLVVITNDGWWRQSSGVWQHFMYSKIRAIETRRTIVRSANTGISGFINQRGDVVLRTKVGETGAVKSSVRLNREQTFYARNGDYIGRICVLISVLIGCLWILSGDKAKKIRINSIVKIPNK